MILQGMVLLLVLIHPLVSQTGDFVCIRAFFRVEAKPQLVPIVRRLPAT